MPAFNENNNEAAEIATVEEEVRSSKFLPKGKYFLSVILILSQAVGAYVLIDEHYKEIYILVFGSLPDYSTTYMMGEIIANPAGTNAQRFLVVEIGIELSHTDHVELLEANMMKIQDRFNEVLSSRTISELVQFQERDRLRRDLAKEVNEAIGVRSVRNLYFTKYVMQ